MIIAGAGLFTGRMPFLMPNQQHQAVKVGLTSLLSYKDYHLIKVCIKAVCVLTKSAI